MGDILDRISEREAIIARLRALPLFADVPPRAVDALADRLEWICLPGGRDLFCQGEPSDALYVVTAGSLAVKVVRVDGAEAVVARIGAGETVGEMSLISGEPHSATVTAQRDSELIRLSRDAYESLVHDHPRAMLTIIALLVRRLRSTTQGVVPAAMPRTVALIPVGPGLAEHDIARRLAAAISARGRRVEVVGAEASDHTTDWFHAVETRSDILIYRGARGAQFWTQFCLRQADRVVLLTRAGVIPARHELPPLDRPVDLLVIHENSSLEAAAPDLGIPVELVVHLRLGNPADFARVGRLLTGQAVGLVLGGGGARGFAHLGVVRALREAGLPFDLVGGSSMGAIVAAGVALEWTDQELAERLRTAFVDSSPLNDYAMPIIALVKGNKVSGRLRDHFGEQCIDAMWRPYFCVSSNLTSGAVTVHRAGLLWRALRASVAIPGLLPPIVEPEGVLVDGGVLNNLPIDVMSALRRGPVIGVDVAADRALSDLSGHSAAGRRSRFGRPPIVDILVRAGTVSTDSQARMMRRQAHVVFEPPLESVDILDWRAWQRAADAGYRHTVETLEKRPEILAGLV